MQDEEIDKLISDAANQHHPPYDDKSWGKMEALLDQHLPQKKDRRRYVFFIVLFLLLGGAIGTAILQPWKNNSTNTTNNLNGNSLVAVVSNPVDGAKNNLPAQISSKPLLIANSKTIQSKSYNNKFRKIYSANNKQLNSEQNLGNNPIAFTKKGKTVVKIKNAAGVDDVVNNSSVIKSSTSNNNSKIEKITSTDKSETLNKVAVNANGNTTEKDIDIIKIATDKIVRPEVAAINNKSVSVINKKNLDKSFVNNFALSVSVGADLSYIEINKAGKAQFVYGIGAGYSIGKHFTLKTGLYISKKVYTAAPYQYKFSSGLSNPNLTGINADCKVYEIPVSIYYKFGTAKNHNWVGGLSLSSLLMKKEKYDYLYNSPAGQTYNYVKTINNENKHYFSVITLSAG